MYVSLHVHNLAPGEVMSTVGAEVVTVTVVAVSRSIVRSGGMQDGKEVMQNHIHTSNGADIVSIGQCQGNATGKF